MLTKVSETLWYVDYRKSFRVASFSLRMTLVLVKGEGVEADRWIAITPVPCSDDVLAEITQKADIAYLVVPSNFHHLFVRWMQSSFPHAQLYMPASLQSKRKDIRPKSYLAAYRADDAEPESYPWHGVLEMIEVRGFKYLEEYVFFHRASGTLIVSDLCTNFPKEVPLVESLLFRFSGIHDGLKTSRLSRFFIEDKLALQESVNKMLHCGFERLVVTHGHVIENSAGDAMRESFAWLLDDEPS